MVMKTTTRSAVCLFLAAEDYNALMFNSSINCGHITSNAACLYIYGTQCRTGLTKHVNVIYEVLMLFYRHFHALVYILCSISLATSDVSHLFVLIFVQYVTHSIATTKNSILGK